MLPRQNFVALIVIAVGALATVGCGAASRPTGVLTGGILFTGNVPRAFPQSGYQTGRVQLVRAGRVVEKTSVQRSHGYRLELAPGTYSLGLDVPRGDAGCYTHVTIRPARTTRANVHCVLHG